MKKPKIQLHRLIGGHHVMLFADNETANNWINLFNVSSDDYVMDTAPNGFIRVVMPEGKWKASYTSTILN